MTSGGRLLHASYEEVENAFDALLMGPTTAGDAALSEIAISQPGFLPHGVVAEHGHVPLGQWRSPWVERRGRTEPSSARSGRHFFRFRSSLFGAT